MWRRPCLTHWPAGLGRHHSVGLSAETCSWPCSCSVCVCVWGGVCQAWRDADTLKHVTVWPFCQRSKSLLKEDQWNHHLGVTAGLTITPNLQWSICNNGLCFKAWKKKKKQKNNFHILLDFNGLQFITLPRGQWGKYNLSRHPSPPTPHFYRLEEGFGKTFIMKCTNRSTAFFFPIKSIKRNLFLFWALNCLQARKKQMTNLLSNYQRIQ